MKRVVIIGGGFAGSHAAKKLQDYFSVTLIDTKDYFEFTPGILRTIVEPEHVTNVQVTHGTYLKKAHLVVGHAHRVTPKVVHVGRLTIPFDYLIVASGSTYALPIKEEDVVRATRAEHIKRYSEKLAKAKQVVIVGGGLVGVELAAEIATHYRDKRLTLIHSGSRLLERSPEKATQHAKKFLIDYGVTLIFNERAVSFNKFVITKNGTRVQADIVFLCTGIVPHTDFLRKDMNALNERGYVKVNKHLQLINNPTMFSAGDVNDCAIEKTAQNSLIQADLVVKNILAIEKNKPLKTWQPRQTPLVISLGKWYGMCIYGRFVWYGRLPGLLKSIIERYEMWSIRRSS